MSGKAKEVCQELRTAIARAVRWLSREDAIEVLEDVAQHAEAMVEGIGEDDDDDDAKAD